jgi:hypothetical protein
MAPRFMEKYDLPGFQGVLDPGNFISQVCAFPHRQMCGAFIVRSTQQSLFFLSCSQGCMRSYWAEMTGIFAMCMCRILLRRVLLDTTDVCQRPGMFFFLFASVGTACSAFKTVTEFSGALVAALKPVAGVAVCVLLFQCQ